MFLSLSRNVARANIPAAASCESKHGENTSCCDVLCTSRYSCSCAQGSGVLLSSSKPKSIKSLAC